MVSVRFMKFGKNNHGNIENNYQMHKTSRLTTNDQIKTPDDLIGI